MKNQPTTELNQQSETTLCAKVSSHETFNENSTFKDSNL